VYIPNPELHSRVHGLKHRKICACRKRFDIYVFRIIVTVIWKQLHIVRLLLPQIKQFVVKQLWENERHRQWQLSSQAGCLNLVEWIALLGAYFTLDRQRRTRVGAGSRPWPRSDGCLDTVRQALPSVTALRQIRSSCLTRGRSIDFSATHRHTWLIDLLAFAVRSDFDNWFALETVANSTYWMQPKRHWNFGTSKFMKQTFCAAFSIRPNMSNNKDATLVFFRIDEVDWTT